MKGRFFRRPQPVRQRPLALDRPAQPNEELRTAFRDAGLEHFGIDFQKLLDHHRASRLLAYLAAARKRGLYIAAKNYERQIMSLKGELK